VAVTTAAPGVLRRPRAQVPFTLRTPITVVRRVRDRGQFIVDAVMDGFSEAEERKHLANRLRPR
jgi:hypothetical protein